MAVLHFRELVAWQKAMDLVVVVYQLSARFPADERFGLTNQVRRAAVSVPSNIAEGQGRGAGASFAQFLRFALGSLQEVETQVLISQRLGYADDRSVLCVIDLIAETGRVIGGLMRSIPE
jgi:four helix bundle protein